MCQFRNGELTAHRLWHHVLDTRAIVSGGLGLKSTSKILDRIQQICNDSIMEAYIILNELIEDVFDLADKFGYNTDRARSHDATVRYANATAISLKKERQP